MATQKADVGRCQLTNCPPRHLDLSLTFLVPLILSSVPEPGPLTQTELCSGLLAVSHGDTDKENLSQPSRTPVPSLPEIVASHAGQNWFMCSAGRSSLRFRTGGREPPRNRKAQVLRTSGIWRGDPQSLSFLAAPPVSQHTSHCPFCLVCPPLPSPKPLSVLT